MLCCSSALALPCCASSCSPAATAARRLRRLSCGLLAASSSGTPSARRGSCFSATSAHLYSSSSSSSSSFRSSKALPGLAARSRPSLLQEATQRLGLLKTMATAAVETTQQKKTESPYGTWKSPITKEFVTAGVKSLGGVVVVDQNTIVRLEGRPSEGGRNVLVCMNSDGSETDLTPKEFNVRTRVHEYGGGAFLVGAGGVIFSNFADQRLYFQPLESGEPPHPITPAVEGAKLRYADGMYDAAKNRVICVQEDHRVDSHEPANVIVAVRLDGTGDEEPVVLASGRDFYAAPRLSPDGRHLAYFAWDHPNMPWDNSTLWVARLDADGLAESHVCLSGNTPGVSEAVLEPQWSPAGELFFVSDKDNGWWNLYRWVGDFSDKGRAESLYPKEAEFSGPQWIFGQKSYTFAPGSSSDIFCKFQHNGVSQLALLHVGKKDLTLISSPYSSIYSVSMTAGRVILTGASASKASSIAELKQVADKNGAEYAISQLWCSSPPSVDTVTPYVSTPKGISFPTKVEGKHAYAIYYPPTNPEFNAPAGSVPPLLVKSHGGPTSATDTSLKLGIQFWTSRGWAVADVNYGGSTGYGREYRERLNGTWGITDVDDCCACAEYLVEQGLADKNRLAIDGGSAGGYTTLAVLTFRDTFRAGASLYGVSDLKVLVAETHKFESRYLDSLIGPVDTAAQLYYDRSPINFTDKLRCPIILFQGLEDKVVPPNQARMMYDAVKAKGLPVAIIEYEGEQHGFRKAENIQRTMEAEMVFYSRVFGFELADEVKPVHIDNLD